MLEADLIDWKYAARTLHQLHVFLTSFFVIEKGTSFDISMPFVLYKNTL